MIKKIIILLITVSSLLFSCASGESSDNNSSGEYHFGGSTTVKPIIIEASKLIKEKYPDITQIHYEAKGSTAGIKGLLTVNPINTLAGVSRELTDKEKDAGIKTAPIAYDGIAVIANKQTVTISNISHEDLTAVFKGEITNWKDLGGPDNDIIVLNRDRASGTRAWFEEVVFGQRISSNDFNTIIVTSNNDMAAKTATIPYSIGYADLGAVTEEEQIKFLSIDKVFPNEENVKNGKYIFSRTLYLAYTEETYGLIEKTIIDYIRSGEGQEMVKELFFIPIQ